jgi:hypothetical protein
VRRETRWLISGPERGTLGLAIQSLKQGVARRLALREKDLFWQARYYDFNVWPEREFVEKLNTFIAIRFGVVWLCAPKTGTGAASALSDG